MKIGIIFAMDEEINEVLKFSNIENEYEMFGIKFYEVTIENKNCILGLCGVGKVNASRCTQIMIDNMKVDFIINVGVAGGLTDKLNVLDIVIGEKLVQHDFDITAFDHEKGYIPNCGVYINSDDYLLKLASDVFMENTNILKGVIASGDIFCTDKKMSEKIHHKFDALCVDMEGASIAQTAFFAGVPFIIVRSISDIPNNHNVITYDTFLEKSSKIISKFLKKLIGDIK